MAKTKVLIIDNEADIVNTLSFMLQARNYLVMVTADPQEGIEKAKVERPDLILFDIMTSGNDGYNVCMRLKSDKDTRNIPLIIITAKGERESIIRCHSCGINDYIVKPFNLATLLGKMRKVTSK